MIKVKRKPKKCPKCKSARIANILYGMPAYSEKLQEDIDAGRIALGGCTIGIDDPRWQCADCESLIYQAPLFSDMTEELLKNERK